MVSRPPRIDSLFDAALQITGTKQRAQFLDQQCAGNPHIREEVERLLQSHAEDPSLLDQAPHSFSPHETNLHNGRSVLQAIGNTFGIETGVELKEVNDQLEEPVQQVSSPEIPDRSTNGRYQLFGEIARGGMGAVIKGRDTDLGRDLAVKVLLEQHRQSPEVVQRFVEEAQIGGQLQHPGIAPVYELGQFEDQRPFFTMKLVKGKTLAAHLAARKDLEADRSKLIGIFEQVCQTMAYAHSRGVIHRDLKPANIMVGAFGEVQVMDWGLAKVLLIGGVADERKATEAHQDRSIIETLRSTGTKSAAGSDSHTQMGSVMGTPAYMPPEQALGEIDQLDQRADVFGLGAILCEILTGKPPYVAADAVQVFRLASRGKLGECYQRLDDCDADRDLVSLAKECLADEPANRPADAGNLAERVSSYQATVETRLRASEIDRAAQTVRADEERKRRRISMALAISIVASVLTLSGGGLWLQSQRTAHAENVARKQEQLATAAGQLANEEKEKSRIQQAANQELRWVLYQSDIRRAQTEIAQGNYSEAKSILKNHLPQKGQMDLRGFEWHFLYRQCPEMTVRKPFQWEGEVPIIEPRPNEVQGQYTEYFYHEISRDGNRIAAIVDENDSGNRKIVVWNTRTGKRVWTKLFEPSGENLGITLDHDGNRIAITSGSKVRKEYEPVTRAIQIWDISKDCIVGTITPQHIPWLKDHSFDVSFRPGVSSIAICRRRLQWLDEPETALLWLWNYETESRQFELDVQGQFQFGKPGFSPDGRWLVVKSRAESHESLHLFDADSGLQKWESSGLTSRSLSKAVFSPDGSKLASVAANRTRFTDPKYEKRDTLLIWDVASGRIEVTAEIQLSFASVTFSPSGQFALLFPETPVCNTEVIRVSDGAKVLQIDKHIAGIWKFSADERFVQAIDHTGTARLWEIPKVGFDLANHDAGWCSLSGDGKRFINKKWDDKGIAHLYNSNGSLIRTIPTQWKTDDWRSHGLLNHDGTLLITKIRDFISPTAPVTTTLWDIERSRKVAELYKETSTQRVSSRAMSPTESKLAVIIANAEDEEFDVAANFEGDAKGEFKHADHQLRIWDLTTLSEQTIELDGEASRLGYSQDGKQIAVYAAHHTGETPSGSITILDSATGKTVQKLNVSGHFDRLEFSRDRRYVVGRKRPFDENPDSRIKVAQSEVWDLQSGERITVIPGGQTMIFSPEGNRLVSIDTMDGSLLPRLTNVFAVWDVETGVQLLSQTYPDNDVRASMGFRFLPDQHVLMGFGYRGPPQFWEGTPVDVKMN